MISGLNHLTISVSDLARSIEFYHGMLGLKLEARWKQGAYLSAGDLWLCLSQGDVAPAEDYTHYAFSVAESAFEKCSVLLVTNNVKRWKTNSSEGDSIYFLDPDGHRLELHAGTLQSRLASLRGSPYEELQLY